MKLTVVHGETQIQISGKHSLKKMKNAVKDILKSLPAHETEKEEESNPIGFSMGATIERSDPIPLEYFFTDDEE